MALSITVFNTIKMADKDEDLKMIFDIKKYVQKKEKIETKSQKNNEEPNMVRMVESRSSTMFSPTFMKDPYC